MMCALYYLSIGSFNSFIPFLLESIIQMYYSELREGINLTDLINPQDGNNELELISIPQLLSLILFN